MFVNLFQQGTFWFAVAGSVVAALLPRSVAKYFYQSYRPSDADVFREREAGFL